MIYSNPVILNEQCPLDNSHDLIDEGLRRADRNWRDLSEQAGSLPTWNTEFAMQNAGIVSRTIMYDTSGDGIEMALIGDQCREFIGLEKTKGPLDELMPEVNVADVRMRIEACTQQRQPNYCLKSMSWNNDKDFLKYEALFLPFRLEGSEACTWIFCPMAFHLGEELAQ